MISCSYEWKQDLLKVERLLVKYNTIEQISDSNDSVYTYSVIERLIYYSAFIIRKLIDCGTKLSDDAEQYAFLVEKYKTIREVNFLNRALEENQYDWENPIKEIIKGKKYVIG